MSTTTPTLDPQPAVAPVRRFTASATRVLAGSGLGPAALACALALVVAALHWKGVDQAAQAYRVAQVRDHGLALWDSGWYGGNYPLGYSLVFPLIGALIGLVATGAVASAGATWSFDRLVTRHLGRRPLGVWYFAASTMLAVAIGQLPYLTGEAFGLAALVAVRSRRWVIAAGLVALSAGCSPLAGAFAVLAGIAWFLCDRTYRRPVIVLAVTVVVVVGGLGLAFPGTGPFPFPVGGLIVTLFACAVAGTSLLPTTPTFRVAALLYGVASLGAFFIANPLGGNAPRLAQSIGIPLLMCFATAGAAAPLSRFGGTPARLDPGRWPLGRNWRTGLTVLVLAALACWEWGPGLGVVFSPASDSSTSQSYYRPLVHQLQVRSRGVPTRVEIPPTREHWEAAWVAPYVSLARGWERQLDIADNPLFYQSGTLEAGAYHRWLVANGVRWVALPATALDYAGTKEGGLLRTGEVKGLHLVWSNRDWKLWKVVGSPGLVSGPATLDTLAPDHVDLTVDHPGAVTIRVRYSSYSAVKSGDACLEPDAAGWTVVRAAAPGPVDLGTSVLHRDSHC